MSNEEIIEEAIKRGYLKASKMIPIHIDTEEVHIPANCYLEISNNFLYLVDPFYDNKKRFSKCRTDEGQGYNRVVYETDRNKWAQITEYFDNNLVEKPIDLLEEAKKRYPISTKYIDVGTTNEKTVRGNFTLNRSGNGYEYITDGWGGSVYKKGIWAEIISQTNTPSKDKPFYVVVTEENKEILSRWLGCDLSVGRITGLNGKHLTKEWNPITNTSGFGEEITFEQFLELYPEYTPLFPKFIKSDWYKDLSSELYIKFDRLKNNDYLCSSERISRGSHSKIINDSWSITTRNWQKLEDLSEIQQYLPDGHPDKKVTDTDPRIILAEKNIPHLKDKPNEWWKDLKKGDIIRRIKNDCRYASIFSKYTILEDYEDRICYKDNYGVLTASTRPSDWELVSKESDTFRQTLDESIKVKEGDWIFVIETEKGAWGANGIVGVITDERITEGINNGLKIRSGLNVWGIGENAKYRLATPFEIEKELNKYTMPWEKTKQPRMRMFDPKHSITPSKFPIEQLKQQLQKVESNQKLYKKEKPKVFNTFVPVVKAVSTALTKEKTSKLITNK